MKPHHIKFAIGAPIIFVLLLNQSGISTSTVNSVALSSGHTRFIEVGEVFNFSIDTQSLIPMNALGVSLSFPSDIVSIHAIEQEGSIVDLWVEKPTYSNTHGTAKLSGGILEETGFIGRGHIATIEFQALAAGKAPVTITDAVLLARDGKGTNILETKENITFIVRAKGDPTPDVSGDGVLSLSDVTLVYFASFRAYDERYDLTKDGDVSFSDVLYLGKLLGE